MIEWGDGLLAQVGSEVLIKAIAHTLLTCVTEVFKLQPFKKLADTTIYCYWRGGGGGG